MTESGFFPNDNYFYIEQLLDNLALRKSFEIKNMGNLNMVVNAIKFDDKECIGYGFYIVNCKNIIIKPNQTFIIDLKFQPDFTMSKINREFVFDTSFGVFKYKIQVVVPQYMLTLCNNILPRPSFELYFYYFSLLLILFVASLIVLFAMFESRTVLKHHFEVVFRSSEQRKNHNQQKKTNFSSLYEEYIKLKQLNLNKTNNSTSTSQVKPVLVRQLSSDSPVVQQQKSLVKSNSVPKPQSTSDPKLQINKKPAVNAAVNSIAKTIPKPPLSHNKSIKPVKQSDESHSSLKANIKISKEDDNRVPVKQTKATQQNPKLVAKSQNLMDKTTDDQPEQIIAPEALSENKKKIVISEPICFRDSSTSTQNQTSKLEPLHIDPLQSTAQIQVFDYSSETLLYNSQNTASLRKLY